MRSALVWSVLVVGFYGCVESVVSPNDGAVVLPPLPDGAVADLSTAQEALERCDARIASANYDAAWRADPTSAEAALGFAITDMLLLGEDPEAAAGLRLWAFSGGIDSETLLWGPSGLLDTLVRHAPSSQYGDYVEATFPYEPIRTGTNGLDAIAPTTTALDVMRHAWAMQGRFERLSSAFELAAQNAPLSIEIRGICGVGEVELNAAELYAFAAIWRGVVLAFQISRGYDWDFLLLDGVDWRDRSAARLQVQADVLNDHLGAISDRGALSGVREEWRRFFELMNAAFSAADRAGAVDPIALLEWRAFRSGLLPALLEQGRTAEALEGGVVTAPGLTPTFDGDLRPLFAGDLDLAAFGRSFSVYVDPMWGDAWIEVDEAPIDTALMMVLSRSPFDDTLGTVEWTHIDAWRGNSVDWQLTEVASTRPAVGPASVPRFVSPVFERYRDLWYFGPRP